MRRMLVALIIGWLVVTGVRAADPVGQVASLEGAGEVVRGGATVALKAGDPVFIGDRVRTQPGAKVRLLLKDETVLTLAPSTELTLDQQTVGSGAPPSSGFGLWGGTVRALVTEDYGKPGAKFQIETPTAVAGVRGTSFVMSYDAGTGVTTVTGISRRTWVRAKGAAGEVVLDANRRTEVRRGGAPKRPAAVGAPQIRRLLEATEVRTGVAPEGEIPATAPATEGAERGVGGFGRPRPGSGAGGGRARGVLDQPIDVIDKPPSQRGTQKPPPPPPGRP